MSKYFREQFSTILGIKKLGTSLKVNLGTQATSEHGHPLGKLANSSGICDDRFMIPPGMQTFQATSGLEF